MTAARPLVKRHHGIVRLAHWLNALVLLGMIGSGLQIYMAFRHFGPAAREGRRASTEFIASAVAEVTERAAQQNVHHLELMMAFGAAADLPPGLKVASGEEAAFEAASAAWPGQGESLPSFTHVLTHLDWTLHPIRWTLPDRLAAARRERLEALWPSGRWFVRLSRRPVGRISSDEGARPWCPPPLGWDRERRPAVPDGVFQSGSTNPVHWGITIVRGCSRQIGCRTLGGHGQ